MARPKRPSYASVTKVLDAFRCCSCGKYDYNKPATSLEDYAGRFRCACVGPRSWSELLRITKLHKSTLSGVCKFLVLRKVLLRNKIKKRGHHGQYSIADGYRRGDLFGSQWDIEAPPSERSRAWAQFVKALNPPGHTEFVEAFQRKYAVLIRALQIKFPELRNLSEAWFMAAVRLIDIYGPAEGLRFLRYKSQQVERLRFEAWVRCIAVGRFDVAASILDKDLVSLERIQRTFFPDIEFPENNHLIKLRGES